MQLLKKAMTPQFWKEVREKDCFADYRRDLLKMWVPHDRLSAQTIEKVSLLLVKMVISAAEYNCDR